MSNSALRDLVALKLSENWSPQQIAGWLKRQFPEDSTMHISHETIYLSLFIQARGALKKELCAHLRAAKQIRRPQKARGVNRDLSRFSSIVDGISIRERPAEIEDRAIPGHWEGDLIVGAKSTLIATLVERHSRFVKLVKIDRKDTKTVTKALSAQIRELPKELRASLTWDRGSELANHKQLTLATDMQIYFCDPRSPWQPRI